MDGRTLIICLYALAQIQVVVGQLCPLEQCTTCTSSSAVCFTQDSYDLVPKAIDSRTTGLYLTYKGAPTSLKKAMVSRFKQLRRFSISGPITSIENGTFADNFDLVTLKIIDSFLEHLPDDCFGSHSRITGLILNNNRLRSIPTNVFKSTKNLMQLDLSYNPIALCNISLTSIGEEFATLSHLDTVSIAGLGNENACQDIDFNNYLSPLARIKQLNIGETSFFHSKQSHTLLNPLKNLSWPRVTCHHSMNALNWQRTCLKICLANYTSWN